MNATLVISASTSADGAAAAPGCEGIHDHNSGATPRRAFGGFLSGWSRAWRHFFQELLRVVAPLEEMGA